MISDNIDLTLHRDFGGSLDTLNDMLSELTRAGQFLEEQGIAFIGQSELELLYSPIFGKRGHHNEKGKIFGYKLDRLTYSTCRECGKEFKVPWKEKYVGVCKDCYDKSQKPWSKKSTSDSRDIFRLK